MGKQLWSTMRGASMPESLPLRSVSIPEVGELRLGKVLGKGANGTVFLAHRPADGHEFAVKVIAGHGGLNELKAGLKLQRSFSGNSDGCNRHVVKLHGSSVVSGQRLCLVLELCKGGELFNYVIEKGPLDEPKARSLAKQLLLGLSAAHTAGVAHRDIKLENLLLTHDLTTLKVTDFGLSSSKASETSDLLRHTKCGSLAYAAPEVLAGGGYCPFKADLWSVGICLCALLYGRMPFDMAASSSRSFAGFLKAIRDLQPTILDQLADTRQDAMGALPLLRRLLDPNPSTRITLKEALQHSWPQIAEGELAPVASQPVSSPVRHLGWTVPAVGLEQLRDAVREAFCRCEIEAIEPQPGEFAAQAISCSVQMDSCGRARVKWLRLRASPFEIKLTYRAVRKELEALLGVHLKGNFELESDDQLPSPVCSEAEESVGDSQPLPIGSHKRKTFEGMAELRPCSKAIGQGVRLIDSAPALSRSKSCLDLTHDLDQPLMFEMEAN